MTAPPGSASHLASGVDLVGPDDVEPLVGTLDANSLRDRFPPTPLARRTRGQVGQTQAGCIFFSAVRLSAVVFVSGVGMPGREEGPDAQIPSQRALWNSWHAEATASDDTAEHGRFRQRLLDLIGPGPAAILELACGRGLDASVYAAAGHDVVATDFSPVAIENARRIHGHGGGLIFEVVDHGEPLPFEAGVFDGVVSHLGLHYFDDPTTVAVFAEIRRVLQSGGHLQLLVKSVHDPQYGVGTEIGPDMYLRGNHLRHFFRRDYLEHVADTAGLTVLMVEEYTGLYYGQRNPSSFIFAQLQKL